MYNTLQCEFCIFKSQPVFLVNIRPLLLFDTRLTVTNHGQHEILLFYFQVNWYQLNQYYCYTLFNTIWPDIFAFPDWRPKSMDITFTVCFFLSLIINMFTLFFN